jgi:predicted ribosomally synthesized peptide with SipW-like signal peptide
MSVTTLPTLTILLHSYNHPFLTAGIGLGPTFAVFNSVSEANQSFSSNVDCNAEFDLRVGWFFFDHGESPDAPAFFLRLSYSLEAFADLTGSKKGTDNRDSTDVAFSWFNQVLQLESGVIW